MVENYGKQIDQKYSDNVILPITKVFGRHDLHNPPLNKNIEFNLTTSAVKQSMRIQESKQLPVDQNRSSFCRHFKKHK